MIMTGWYKKDCDLLYQKCMFFKSIWMRHSGALTEWSHCKHLLSAKPLFGSFKYVNFNGILKQVSYSTFKKLQFSSPYNTIISFIQKPVVNIMVAKFMFYMQHV